jgi:hypothetical protein
MYPRRSAHWKKTRQAVHTAADPPKSGSSRFAAIGSMRKRRELLRKIATAYRRPDRAGEPVAEEVTGVEYAPERVSASQLPLG